MAYVKRHAPAIRTMGLRDAQSRLPAERQPSAITRGFRRITRRLSMAFHPENDGFIVADPLGPVTVVTPDKWVRDPTRRVVVAQQPRSGLAVSTPPIPAGVLPRVPRVAPVDAADAARAAEFRPIHEPQRINAVPGWMGEPIARRGRVVPMEAAPVVIIPGKSVIKCVVATGMAGPLYHWADRARVVEWLQTTPMSVGGWAPSSGSEASTSTKLVGDKGVGSCSDGRFKLVAPPTTATSSDEAAPPASAGRLSPTFTVLQAATFHDKPGIDGIRKVGRSRVVHCWETASLG